MDPLVVLLSVVAIAFAAPSPPVEPAQQGELTERLASARRVESVAADCDRVGAESTTRALSDHGSAAVEWIVAVRLGLAQTAVAWTDCLREAATATLRSRASLSRDELVAQLFAAPEPLPLEPAMLLLAELGDERDLAMLLDWALELEAHAVGDEFSGAAAQALRSAVARLAAYGASDRRAWSKALERAPVALRVALVRGLADCGKEDALARIAEQLDASLLGDSLLLAELTRATRRFDRLHSAELRRTVRLLLASSDEGTLRDAALCSGALGDEDAAPVLIGLLEHGHPGVRTNAEWALQRITGRRLGPSPSAWSRWVDAETTWWQGEAPQLLRELSGANRQARVAAAQALSSHRFPRHSLALELADAAPLNDAPTAAIVCAALRRLGSESAAEALEARLEDALDPAVRELLIATVGALRAARAPGSASGPANAAESR